MNLTCSVHNKEFKYFCKTCKSFLCGKCSQHRYHKVERLEEYMRSKKGEMPDLNGLGDIKNQISEAKFVVGKRELVEQKKRLLESEVLVKVEKWIADPDETHDSNSDAIAEISQAFLEASEKMKSAKFKKVLGILAVNILKNIDDILDEIVDLSVQVVKLRDYYSRGGLAIKNILAMMNVLDNLPKVTDPTNMSKSNILGLMMLRERCYIDTPIEPLGLIDSYKVLPKIFQTFDIYRVMSQPLINYKKGIMISHPIDVALPLLPGDFPNASISPNGILGISVYNPKGFPEDVIPNFENLYYIQLINLVTGENMKVDVPYGASIGFYDNKMIVMYIGKKIQEGDPKEVFEKKYLAGFEELETERVSTTTDLSLLNTTRKIYYSAESTGMIYEYDVDFKTNKEITGFISKPKILSTTGIYLNIKCIFQNLDTDAVSYVSNDGSIHPFPGNPKTKNFFRAYIPSKSEPSNLEKGLLKDFKYFVSGSRIIKPDYKYVFCWKSYPIRIMNDVFLVLNRGRRIWSLYRIIVP